MKMSNLLSEQLRSDLSLDISQDQALKPNEIKEVLINVLGEENCTVKNISNKKVLVYTSPKTGKEEILLYAAVTYLGGNGQHPIFKKRMQLKNWYKDVFNSTQLQSNYNVRFIGVYHYQKNVIFVEFLKDTYLTKKMNNSAAHVYVNDLYQGMKNGVFHKVDKNKNKLKTIRYNIFRDYLDNCVSEDLVQIELLDYFSQFNEVLPFDTWIRSMNAIPEMYKNKWKHWKQGEWPGWYLEFLFDKYISSNNLQSKIKYVGSSNKSSRSDDFDFDLFFGEEQFYGDLKASDKSKNETPGNDQTAFINCINKYDKFWYVVYEHNTLKDKDSKSNFEATRFRTNFIRKNNEWDSKKPWDEYSYHSRMKHSIEFVDMYIIELNRINFRTVLSDFNQGRQPSGKGRNVKFKIDKRNIDNFVIFRKSA